MRMAAGQRRQGAAFDRRSERVVVRLLRLGQLLAAGVARQVVDDGADLLDGGVSGFEAVNRFLFGDFGRARLDHHDAVFAAGDHQIEAALLALRVGRD